MAASTTVQDGKPSLHPVLEDKIGSGHAGNAFMPRGARAPAELSVVEQVGNYQGARSAEAYYQPGSRDGRTTLTG